jgi:hypothetical protein
VRRATGELIEQRLAHLLGIPTDAQHQRCPEAVGFGRLQKKIGDKIISCPRTLAKACLGVASA